MGSGFGDRVDTTGGNYAVAVGDRVANASARDFHIGERSLLSPFADGFSGDPVASGKSFRVNEERGGRIRGGGWLCRYRFVSHGLHNTILDLPPENGVYVRMNRNKPEQFNLKKAGCGPVTGTVEA